MNTPTSPSKSALPMPVTKRPHGRSVADFGELLPAEQKLRDCSATGKEARFGDRAPADDSDPTKIVRASFLRFLLLGGDEQTPVHEKGVQLIGAWIEGPLELRGCYVPRGMALMACTLNKRIEAHDAHIAGLFVLNSSRLLEGLGADGLRCDSDVFLQNGFHSADGVWLINAQIGGDLNCSGGQFSPPVKECALLADGIVVSGSVHLRCGFKATGGVSLIGAQIGGDLDCHKGDFATSAAQLYIQSTTIRTAKFHDLVRPAVIKATAAQVGELWDDRSAWATGSTLNGLVYKSLHGAAPTDVATRIDWLRKQTDEHLGEDTLKQGFRPQPWKHLQNVLREMGYYADARAVGVAFEDQLRKADRIGQIADAGTAKNIFPVLRRKCLRALHWLFGFLAGYGYHPLRLFMSLVGVWLFCGVIYWWLAYAPHSAIGPTDPLVFQNTAYSACAKENNGNWMLCEQLPAEYTTFSPLAYSLDILLPLVDLGQEKRWGPLTPTPEKNFCVELLSLSPPHWVRLLNWFQILYGWVASLLFVAIVSGMSRRSEMDK
jgi:hypothetical protein